MKLTFSDLWRWQGEISRGTYLVWAASLFALKYNLDRLLLKVAFNRDWSILGYVESPSGWLKPSPAESPAEYAALLAMALPFLWSGVALCVKRLRAARLPLWLLVLFVVPVLKWFLFAALSLVPNRREGAEAKRTEGDPYQGLQRWFPKSALGSGALAVGFSLALAVGATALGAGVLRNYGWGLFVGAPFCMGFSAALIHGARQRRKLCESLLVAFLSVVLAGAALLALAFEGIICILMAAPLALALALIGALAGHMAQASLWRGVPPHVYCVPVLAIPLMLGAEHLSHGPAPLLAVTSAVVVNAPPERVWRHVVSFAELPPPRETLFRLGIAYPVRAQIAGHGPGALRHCVFSTGSFVEPIEVWDKPRLLQFSVTQNPAPMQEWTPYRHVHPPHLNGFLVSRKGRFLLTPLPGGRTRLEGTTWYHHTMWPAHYWQLWSDHIIHSIHLRVLNHVKRLSEEDRL